jgi:hypothetical protein
MSRVDQQRTSRSLAIYGLLLNLYPREYLQDHRAEMVQNFEDFERTSSSRSGLWLFFGKDFAISVMAQLARSRWGQTAIVFIVLIGVLAAVRHRHCQHEHFTWGFCGGYVLGWFSGWWRKERQIRLDKPSARYFKSFLVDAAIICFVLATVLLAAHSFARIHERPIWALCYGYIIAVPAGWLGKRWQSRP